MTEKSASVTYEVLVRDEFTCPLALRTFIINIDCVPKLFIPTAFTPNGDLLNDLLEIYGSDFANLDFTIYNRWGEIVFKADSKTDVWDGKVNGKNAPEGVYIWKANFENILQPGKVIRQSGRITLMR